MSGTKLIACDADIISHAVCRVGLRGRLCTSRFPRVADRVKASRRSCSANDRHVLERRTTAGRKMVDREGPAESKRLGWVRVGQNSGTRSEICPWSRYRRFQRLKAACEQLHLSTQPLASSRGRISSRTKWWLIKRRKRRDSNG